MKLLFSEVKILFFSILLLNFSVANAENIPPKNSYEAKNQILIESNIQRSDLENSIFHAEGDVKITNLNKEFIAKSNKAIFYKIDGIIKLIGNVEIITDDLSKINAGEVLYYLEDNKFEAVSNLNQRVNTKFNFNKNN